jgi:histidinol-phosphate/aromatic aminotransferase/cobyric acid decarboxylase-like protein
MTKALKKAFEAASRLPDADQDELAAAILEELEADERWEAAFAGSQDALARLADEALEEHRAGRTEPLDPDAL